MPTLTISNAGDSDYRGQSLADVTALTFANGGSGDQQVYFNVSQFGSGLISTSLSLTGDNGRDIVRIYYGAGESFSAASFSFNNWNSNDYLVHLGANGAETITGSGAVDEIYAEGGNDTIDGGSGNDIIRGGAGDDVMNGGGGADEFQFDYGVANGSDIITDFDIGNDTLRLGRDGPAWSHLVISQTYDGTYNVLTYVDGTISINVGANSYWVDQWNGRAGYNLVSGYGGTLNGTSGADYISTGGPTTNLSGNDGDDVLMPGSDNDAEIIDGGAGYDIVTYIDVSPGVDVYLSSGYQTNHWQLGSPPPQEDTLVSIEGVVGSAYADGLYGNGASNFLYGGGGDDTLSGEDGDDFLFGGAGNDTIYEYYGLDQVHGDAGDDTIVVSQSTQADVLDGGDGVDLLRVSGNASVVAATLTSIEHLQIVQTYTLTMNASQLAGITSVNYQSNGGSFSQYATVQVQGAADVSGMMLTGGQIKFSFVGTAAAETFVGGIYADTFNAGAGADSMTGGLGDDTYYVDDAGDAIVEAAGQGSDIVFAAVSYTLSANVEYLYLQGTSDIAGTGNAGANQIVGNSGANALQGGDGVDELRGGSGDDALSGEAGDDSLWGQDGADLIDGGAGLDTAWYFGSAAVVVDLTLSGLAQNTVGAGMDTLIGIENLTGGDGADALTGDGGVNVLDGGYGNDTIDGGDGNDTLRGNNDDDVLQGGGGDDVVNGGSGLDTASYASAGSAVTVSLALQGAAQNTQGAGSDTLSSIERLIGSVFSDTLMGDFNANILSGGDGNDDIDGGAGADTMQGGLGNDAFHVDNAGDVVQESDGVVGGSDSVYSSVSYAMPANVETLFLTGAANIDATGSAFNDSIWGNTGANVLTGGAGADHLFGDAGADMLNGGDDNDDLDGGAGADLMIGGAGNDTYAVDDAGDVIQEAVGEGDDDFIFASINIVVMGANVEGLYVDNVVGDVQVTGNASDNAITVREDVNTTIDAGGGNDVISSGAGLDVVNGGAGNDWIYTYTGGDIIDGGDGVDTYQAFAASSTITIDLAVTTAQDIGGGEMITLSNVENLLGLKFGLNVFSGNDAANAFSGGAGADQLEGRGGDDTLNGFGGNDVLTGGAGNDTLDGGAGEDTAGFNLASTGATWTRQLDGAWVVVSAEGTDTLTGVELLQFSDRTVRLDLAEGSFSNDGTTDILFRRADGVVASWDVAGAAITAATFLPAVGPEWTALATGDIDGDGSADVIWERDDGVVYYWHMGAGNFEYADVITGIGPEWSFLGAGDFNGDFTDDLAWRRDDGVVYVWQMNNASIESAAVVAGVGSEWSVRGIGDFNGDGRDDFLWRNGAGQMVIWSMNGATIESASATSMQIGLEWEVAGVGDTNGDGYDDIILQRSNGSVRVWSMNGSTVTASANVASADPAHWSAENIGDYNGDGRDDILWMRDDGTVYVWLLNGTSIIGSGGLSGVGPEWSIVGGG